MSEKYKQAFKDAQKELEEKEMNGVKDIIKRSLKRLKELKKEKADLDEKIKYVKMDLEDLKNGKLGVIEERQRKDPDAKDNSVIIVIKEKIVERCNPWYVPYRITWNEPYQITCNNIMDTDCNGTETIYDSTQCTLTTGNHSGCTITCSQAKDYSIGTYDLNGWGIVNFR